MEKSILVKDDMSQVIKDKGNHFVFGKETWGNRHFLSRCIECVLDFSLFLRVILY